MIMLLHLTRVDDVMCFKCILFLFLVQKKRLELNLGEKWNLLSIIVNIRKSRQYFLNENINDSLFIKWDKREQVLSDITRPRHKRLNTGMAPTRDWMIKIAKVSKLYLNSLLMGIVNSVSQSGTMKYQCKWKHWCVKQEMVTNIAKRRQPFLFSEVIQGYSMKKSSAA